MMKRITVNRKPPFLFNKFVAIENWLTDIKYITFKSSILRKEENRGSKDRHECCYSISVVYE